jgi:glycosyltransferase involved in cell wall biosynthesis
MSVCSRSSLPAGERRYRRDLPQRVPAALPARCRLPHGPISVTASSGHTRVLHALAPAPVGGLESVVALLAREFTARGGTVALALSLDRPSIPAVFEELAGHGIELFTGHFPGRGYRGERAFYARTIATWQPQVVHTHGYRADLLAGSAASAFQAARVSTLHGFTGGGCKNRLYEWLQVRTMRKYDGVIAVAPPIRERLRRSGVRAERIHLIPNAWAASQGWCSRAEARERLGLPQDAAVIGSVGRLSREKGVDVLLEALPALVDIPWHLSIIGDGDQREALGRLATKGGITKRVSWHGMIAAAARFYPAFDCLVLSSRTEGTPIVLLEAMAAGVPIIATRVGGVPDLVREQDGWLVAPERPAELASAIRTVLGDPGAAGARVTSARDRVRQDYAPGPWVDRHEAVYRSILISSGRAA